MKLRNKILVYTLPLILFPLILLALANYYFVERANNIQKEEEKTRDINQAIVEIRQEIQNAKNDVKLIGRTFVVSEYLKAINEDSSKVSDFKQNAENSLETFFTRNPYYLELSLFSKDGEELIKYSKLPKTNNNDSKTEEIFDKSLGGYEDKVLQMPIRKLDRFNSAVPFSVRIIKDTFLGVVVLKLSSNIFQRPLKSLSNAGLCSYMFNEQGSVFAGEKLPDCKKESVSQTRLTEITKEVANLDFVGSNELKFDSDLDNSHIFVRPVYFSTDRLTGPTIPSEKWFLGVYKLETSSYSQNAFTILFFSVLALAIGLMYFAASIFAKKLTNPIESVSFATTQIARGESIPDLDIKSGDEIEDLASAVQQMNLDLKNYQKQLVQSAKLATMGEMTARISHEIQNRVSGISLWVQYLDSELDENDEMQKYLDEMKQGLNGFTDLLANLKSYYRTPDLELGEVNLNSLIENSLNYVREKTDQKDISINLKLANSIPNLQGDEEKLKSVIINLLLNSLEAIEQNGKIDLKTKLFNEDQILLTITDNGCGIAKEDLSQIFYPFHSTKSSGSGLGLAITSTIISAHKGKIEVESEVGKGTAFKVFLPRNTKSTKQHEETQR